MGLKLWLSRKTGMPIWRGELSETTYEPVRDRPYGTRVESHGPDKVVFSFKAIVRHWWMLPMVFLVTLVFGVLPLATSFLVFGGPSGSLVFLFLVGLLGWLTWMSYQWAYPWVQVVATRDYIRVGPYYFDRARYDGITIGYEITVGGNSHRGMTGMPWIWKGLRLTYGPWGEELPYMIPDYHSVAVALWIRLMISTVQVQPPGPSTEHGLREQKFES